MHELVCAELVGLYTVPGEFWARRTLVPGPNTIEPVVSGNKVASWVADDRTIQLLESLDYILAEAVVIRQRAAGVIEAAVDATTHMPDQLSALVRGSVRPWRKRGALGGCLDVSARRGGFGRDFGVFCQNTKHNENTRHLLCEARIDIVIDLGDLVFGIDGDGRLLLLGDLGEGRHCVGVYRQRLLLVASSQGRQCT